MSSLHASEASKRTQLQSHPRAVQQAMTTEELLSFAKFMGERKECRRATRGMRRLGRQSGYPDCCVEFFCAVAPLHMFNIDPGATAAYWERAGKVKAGFVPCPECLDLLEQSGVPGSALVQDPPAKRAPRPQETRASMTREEESKQLWLSLEP